MSFTTVTRFLLPAALVGLCCTPAALAATSNSQNLVSEFEGGCPIDSPPDLVVDAQLDADKAGKAPAASLCDQYFAAVSQVLSANANDSAAQAAALANLGAEITPDEVLALHTSLVQISASQIRAISLHLQHGRSQQSVANSDSTAAMFRNPYYGGSAGEASSANAISVFASGGKSDGNQDQTANEVGYDLTNDQYTVGLDIRFGDAWVGGFAYGNSDVTLEYDEAGNETANQADHYLLFTSWYRDNFAADLVLGHASGEFDTRRQVPGGVALGTADNQIAYASLSGSYNFVEGSVSYGPHAGFDYMDGKVDGFAETNGNGWDVAFARQDVKSQVYYMGWHLNYAASLGWGVLVPYLRAEWRTEFEEKRDLIAGHFVQDPANPFTLRADESDANWFQVSAGMSVQLPHGIAVFVDYEAVTGYQDTDLYTINAGLRWEL